MIDLKKLRTKNMGESALVHSAGHIRRIRHSVVAEDGKERQEIAAGELYEILTHLIGRL